MLDRLFVEEQIIRLTNDILRMEKFLKYAKDYNVVLSKMRGVLWERYLEKY